MIEPWVVLSTFLLYMASLFAIALWVERKSALGRSPANNPYIYSLSLAVYCTAWTYYGSVGKAATSGLLFLPIYLGPTLMIFLWWVVLRKLVRLKNQHRITSIADFISARYNKSQPVAALATIIAIVGLVPYVALQLRAVISTFVILTTPSGAQFFPQGQVFSWVGRQVGPVVVAVTVLFTIIIGVRKLDPTERHEGMVVALAVECLVKLVAFLAVGVFVTYGLYDGVGDILQRFALTLQADLMALRVPEASAYVTWTTYLILSMSAILFLPRQFHVAVVENCDERHILTAMWCFPLYMLLINLFVLPIALGGLLEGYSVRKADAFVLLLPLHHGHQWLSLLVFLGGFSAAAGMIMVTSVTLATMITNHLLLPLVAWVPRLNFVKRHLLRCRWVAVASFIVIGYWFEERLMRPYLLVNMGLISFAAVFQFAPVILGGIFWRRANRTGAMLGLGAGFAVWCYTQLLPSFVRNGWLPSSLLEAGPWGVEALKPEALFGLTGLDSLSHTLFWSLLGNVGCYVLGSLAARKCEDESGLAAEFVNALAEDLPLRRAQGGEAYILAVAKCREIQQLLEQYFPADESYAMLQKCLGTTGIQAEDRISIVQLVELHDEVEKCLAGAIGSAAAYRALREGTLFTPRERRDLSGVYGEILTNLRLTPGELKQKVDYYQERETLLHRQAQELEEKVLALEREILERKRAQEALRQSEERYRGLVETMAEGLTIEDGNGDIVYVNDKLCEMWGGSRENILGRPKTDFLDAAGCKALMELTAEVHQGTALSGEITWTALDGRRIATLVSSVPMFDGDGRNQGCFWVITDISQIKALERERANMISMFAHDMRSSLTGIHGLGLRLLNKWTLLDEGKKNEYLEIINREAAKLESLVDDFLEFSRLESGRMKLSYQAISLEKELMELHQVYWERARQRGLQLVLQIDEALPIIEADVNRLRRVFTNLLDNAIKFSREAGTITLAAGESDAEVMVKIVDEGIGIEAEELPFVFDLFHRGRTGERREGYGIGLATVKAIVEGHGGRVHVMSEPGKGSTFTVFVPKRQRVRDE
jgi:PAS domain S-box-containing protein